MHARRSGPRTRRSGRLRGAYLLSVGCLVGLALPGCSGAGSRNTLPIQTCRSVVLRAAGTATRVVGAEDLAVDADAGFVYISAYDRRTLERQVRQGQPHLLQGGVYRLPLEALDQHGTGELQLTVTDLTLDFKRTSDLHPHGISLWSGEGGARSLLVINRTYRADGHGWRLTPRIDVFDLRGGKLEHRRSGGVLTDPQLCGPNDLVALGPRRFLVTNDHGSCTGWQRLLEDVLGLARSYVLYYDGHRFRRVAGGIAFANGIAVGPPGAVNPDRLYVAATRGRGVLVYDIADLLSSRTPQLRPQAVVPLGAGVDNLEWGDDGKMYAPAHVSLWRFALYRQGLVATSPVRLGRIEPDLPPERSVTELARAGKPWLAGTTVATVAGGHLLLGAAFADRLMLCDVAPQRGSL